MNGVTEWKTNVLSALDTLGRLTSLLGAPPAGGTRQERLDALLAVRARLAPDNIAPDPARAAADRLADRLSPAVFREQLQVTLYELAQSVDKAVADLLGAGATDGRLIRSVDFHGA